MCVSVESCTHKTQCGVPALSDAEIHEDTLSLCDTVSLRLSVCGQELNPQPKCAPHTHTECIRCFSCQLPCVHACVPKCVREREKREESETAREWRERDREQERMSV